VRQLRDGVCGDCGTKDPRIFEADNDRCVAFGGHG
jgi:hypothetical protein